MVERENQQFKTISFEFNEDPRTSLIPQTAYGVLRDRGFDPFSFDVHYVTKNALSSVGYNFPISARLPSESDLGTILRDHGIKFINLQIRY